MALGLPTPGPGMDAGNRTEHTIQHSIQHYSVHTTDTGPLSDRPEPLHPGALTDCRQAGGHTEWWGAGADRLAVWRAGRSHVVGQG